MKLDILSEIKKTIDIEMNGLNEFTKIIDDNCVSAINKILQCQGKVVMIGIGKSGLVAKKIASTLSSTGTPAIFVHPAEGMHGDLGVIQSTDVVIAISNGGESAELLGILSVLKKMGTLLISITGNRNSTLARASDTVISIGEIKEACPLNLAPTTSTTVTMVLGDAIAVTLMKLKDFKVDDFALYHPGGKIGKRLLLQISDIIRSPQSNPIVHIEDSIKKMLIEITEKQAGAVSVVDDDGKLVGFITDYDLRTHLLTREQGIFSLKISDIMTRKPVFAYENEKAFQVLEKMQMREKPINVMPVLDHNEVVVSVIRMHDLINVGL